MNVLLPTDFSENSLNAISYAIDFWRHAACNFYIIHVNGFDTFMAGDSTYILTEEQIEDMYIQPTNQKLSELLNQIHEGFDVSDNQKFHTMARQGFFLDTIRKAVLDHQIDMIIMGTKGASGLKQYIIGSNTADVITKVKCNTLVVPENAEYNSFKEIAFPTDYNITYDVNILQPLIDILENTGANLRFLHIKEKGVELNSDEQISRDMLNDFFENFKLSCHYLTNTKVEDAIQCFVESRSIDLIIMVAKSLNYFQSILFHSKIEKVTYHTDIPFLVVHE